MTKKEYVGKYVKILDDALKGLFDEGREEEILAADKAALDKDYEAFEEKITAAYDLVKAAKASLEEYAETL